MSTTTVPRNHSLCATRVIPRLALLSVGVAATVAAVGYLPTAALAGPPGWRGLWLGLSIALAATLAGLVPLALTFGHSPRRRLTGILSSMAVRFVVMVVLLLAAMFSDLADKVTLAVWAATGYVVLLAADTVGLLWLCRGVARTPP